MNDWLIDRLINDKSLKLCQTGQDWLGFFGFSAVFWSFKGGCWYLKMTTFKIFQLVVKLSLLISVRNKSFWIFCDSLLTNFDSQRWKAERSFSTMYYRNSNISIITYVDISKTKYLFWWFLLNIEFNFQNFLYIYI